MTAAADYAQKGLTVCDAMLDMVTRYPNKALRPDHILWHGLSVKIADCFSVPDRGIVGIDILSRKPGTDHGVDLKIEGGSLRLADGQEISLLRTWADDRYEDSIKYPYSSSVGRLCVWNVYKTRLPSGAIREDKWTGNAGFWVELVGENQRIYHCSFGAVDRPDFESFVFRVTVTSTTGH